MEDKVIEMEIDQYNNIDKLKPIMDKINISFNGIIFNEEEDKKLIEYLKEENAKSIEIIDKYKNGIFERIFPEEPDPNIISYLCGKTKELPDKEYSPKRYIPNNDMTLSDTIELMNSDNFVDRFIAEYYQTKIRYTNLLIMISKYRLNVLPFKPKCDISLFEAQAKHMETYLNDLEKRAEIEGITLV